MKDQILQSMNILDKTTRFFVPCCFLFGLAIGQAQTDNNCYDADNAGKVGQSGWTGCAEMYIVKNLDELEDAIKTNYTITHTADDGTETEYTFKNANKNIFTRQVTSMKALFLSMSAFNEDIGYWDTSSVTKMGSMFRNATAFNKDLSGWNVFEIKTKPTDFDTGATSWTNASYRPQWGTDGSGTASTNDPALQALVLYPNPVTHPLYIQSPRASELRYWVYDLTGKALSAHHQTGQTHRIDLSALVKGVYLLKVSHKNTSAVYRFVKS